MHRRPSPRTSRSASRPGPGARVPPGGCRPVAASGVVAVLAIGSGGGGGAAATLVLGEDGGDDGDVAVPAVVGRKTRQHPLEERRRQTAGAEVRMRDDPLE